MNARRAGSWMCGALILLLQQACLSGDRDDAALAVRTSASLFGATRALGVEAPAALASALDAMPPSSISRGPEDRAQRLSGWQMFFRGSLLKLGRLSSATPLALHYNPILDVALVQGCDHRVGTDVVEGCQKMCAVPGEVLSDANVLDIGPEWLSQSNPMEGLAVSARTRVDAFEVAHPADSGDLPGWQEQFCRPDWQEIAEQRVLHGLIALHNVDVVGLGGAIARYADERGTADPPAPSGVRETRLDYLLSNLSSFVPTGAVELPGERQLIFFTPRTTGWYAVAVLTGAKVTTPEAGRQLLDATTISFAREVER